MCKEGTTIFVTTHPMDEAEHCNHLAIIDQGLKVADGTPQSLKDNLTVQIMEICGENLSEVKQTLQPFKRVISTTQVGIALRVMIRQDVKQAAKWLYKTLIKFKHLSLIPAKPSIEDLFVMATSEKSDALSLKKSILYSLIHQNGCHLPERADISRS